MKLALIWYIIHPCKLIRSLENLLQWADSFPGTEDLYAALPDALII